MAAKKNEVNDVKETVVEEEPAVEVTDDVVTDDTDAAKAEPTEKKEGFFKKFWNKQISEFKEHPVKKTAKTIGGAAVTVLAVIGGTTVVKKLADNNSAVDDSVQLLTDNLADVVEDVKVEEF